MLTISRRKFLTCLFAAPAIIAIDRLMPVKVLAMLRDPTKLFVDRHMIPNGLTFSSLADALAASITGDTVVVSSGHLELAPWNGFVIDKPKTTIIGGSYIGRGDRPVFVSNATDLTIRNASLLFSSEDQNH